METLVNNKDIIQKYSDSLDENIEYIDDHHIEYALCKLLKYIQTNDLFIVNEINWFAFEAGYHEERGLTKGLDPCLWSLLHSTCYFWEVLNEMVTNDPKST